MLNNYLPITLGIARPEPKAGRVSQKKKSKRAGSTSGPSSSQAAAQNKQTAKDLPKELKEKILKRDNDTCRFCGFHSGKYQTVHHLDNNPNNTSEDNLATACIFCHQCFNLDIVGAMTSGTLIWMPEIKQHELHHIARAIYVARISQGPIAEASRKALDAIMDRRKEALRRIQTDDPYVLATVLSDYLGMGHYMQRQKKLEGIRLFPLDRRMVQEANLSFNQFPQILAYWRSKNGPFGDKTPPQWLSVYQNARKA